MVVASESDESSGMKMDVDARQAALKSSSPWTADDPRQALTKWMPSGFGDFRHHPFCLLLPAHKCARRRHSRSLHLRRSRHQASVRPLAHSHRRLTVDVRLWLRSGCQFQFWLSGRIWARVAPESSVINSRSSSLSLPFAPQRYQGRFRRRLLHEDHPYTSIAHILSLVQPSRE